MSKKYLVKSQACFVSLNLERFSVSGVQRGEVSAEVAAGVFYQERRALLAALQLLLSAAAAAGPEAAGGAAPVVHRFVGTLLAERRGGRSALLSRLLDLVQVCPDCWALVRVCSECWVLFGCVSTAGRCLGVYEKSMLLVHRVVAMPGVNPPCMHVGNIGLDSYIDCLRLVT